MSNENSPMNDQEKREYQIDLFFGPGNWRYADDRDFSDILIEYWNGFTWVNFVAADSCRRCSFKCISKIRDIQRHDKLTIVE